MYSSLHGSANAITDADSEANAHSNVVADAHTADVNAIAHHHALLHADGHAIADRQLNASRQPDANPDARG